MISACIFVFAMTRDIVALMMQPDVRKQWINIVKDYITKKYIEKSVRVDAIVGPDRRGYLFAFATALTFDLPYILIHEPDEVITDQDDIIHETYDYLRSESRVNCLIKIYHLIFLHCISKKQYT